MLNCCLCVGLYNYILMYKVDISNIRVTMFTWSVFWRLKTALKKYCLIQSDDKTFWYKVPRIWIKWTILILSSKETKIIDVCRYLVDWLGLGYHRGRIVLGESSTLKNRVQQVHWGGGNQKKFFISFIYLPKLS